MFGLGTQELLIFAFIAVLLFGSAKLPKFARDLGSSLVELRKGFKDGIED